MGRNFFSLHARFGRKWQILLGVLPFVLLVLFYIGASHYRRIDNPQDKLLPSVTKMVDAVERMGFTEDRRTGKYLLWSDTLISLKRLLIGVLAAALFGLFVGLNLGIFPGPFALFQPVVTFIAIIPPLAILPIIFLVFGVGEFSKIFLIFLGTAPVITRDIMFTARKIPAEQCVKALTLGASSISYVYRIVLPQILPRLLEAVRLSLGAAWLFLIAAEAIASEGGLGYRIFLVRRYLAMDVIIPYALWITFLGFLLDYGLRKYIRYAFPWYVKEEG